MYCWETNSKFKIIFVLKDKLEQFDNNAKSGILYNELRFLCKDVVKFDSRENVFDNVHFDRIEYKKDGKFYCLVCVILGDRITLQNLLKSFTPKDFFYISEGLFQICMRIYSSTGRIEEALSLSITRFFLLIFTRLSHDKKFRKCTYCIKENHLVCIAY